MITATIKIFVTAERKKDILETLFNFAGPVEVMPGCLGCHVTQDVEDPLAITYTEEWQTQEDLERHLRSPNYLLLLQLIDLSEREPEVRFMTTTACWGMEFIEKVRGK